MNNIKHNLQAYISLAMICIMINFTAACAHAQSAAAKVATSNAPTNLTAEGHDSRVDLIWDRISDTDLDYFNVYRSESKNGPFTKINKKPHQYNVYSDFIGENDKHFFYKVTILKEDGIESAPSAIVSAKTFAMTDEELLTSIQKATFRFFWDFAHPVSGFARAGTTHESHARDICVSGGTGFGLFNLIVGAERDFITREQAAKRTLKIVRFLQDKTPRYHGAWAHRFNGRTGETIPFFNPADNGGDIVETSFLVEGILASRQYFTQDNPIENEIRKRSTQLWEEVEWDWYLRYKDGKILYWHWSPDYGWKKNHPIHGFNECMITYLLAIASPTHPIPDESYNEGWIKDPKKYANGNSYFGYKKAVGLPTGGPGGPLFFTHYSYLGLDPNAITDQFTNYFEHNKNMTLINRAHCIENPGEFKDYSALVWGLTSSENPKGYKAHAPIPGRDDGTITPTAALSAMPYTPEESIATMKHFYHTYGKKLWGPFGFNDAFNPTQDWYSENLLAIDAGPIVPMMENYRTGLCWDIFMKNKEITDMLKRLNINTK
ncbi:glucoamylase family protein [Poriferisphaera sp. WC338]|uniref:glucoamylase family protein n=1 Tax=Poriferisphaera sp. WC338 TaxID=3425129 RepID=UPI003D81C25D